MLETGGGQAGTGDYAGGRTNWNGNFDSFGFVLDKSWDSLIYF